MVPGIAPGIPPTVRAARGFFPFGFGRETFACPPTIVDGIVPADIDDGVICNAGNRRSVLPQRCSGIRVFRNAVSCLADEAFVRLIGNFKTIDPEGAQEDFSLWMLIVKALAVSRGPHEEFSLR